MPNWCANRLRVTGLAENVSKVRALMRGEVRPLYARAEAEGIRHLKKGQGSWWLLNLLYWYLPTLFFRVRLLRIPDSCNRHWMQ